MPSLPPINLEVSRNVNGQLIDECVKKAQEICQQDYNQNLNLESAEEGCKGVLGKIIEDVTKRISTPEANAYKDLVAGMSARADSAGNLKPVWQLFYKMSIEDIGNNIGVFVAEGYCSDGGSADRWVGEILSVNKDSEGRDPEASANEPNYLVIGVALLALAGLSLISWRYFGSRFFSKPVQEVVKVAEKAVERLAA